MTEESNLNNAAARNADGSVISATDIRKLYGELAAVDGITFNVQPGETYGLLGPNGAGKTTTIRILATLLKPTWGEARVAGCTVGWQNQSIRPLIGYVPDIIGRYDDMLVSEYLEFFAACYGIHGSKRVKAVGDVPRYMGPDQFTKHIASDFKRYRAMATDSGILVK